jgi:ABC-type oligopeptide transport system substrate-binding subunit
MKLELTALEAINLNATIVGAQTRIKGAKLALGMRLAYNQKQLAPITEALEENRVKLLTECAEKDKDGAPLKDENGGIKLADAEKFNTGINEMLKEKFDVELKQIDLDLLPEKIDADIVAGLFTIIVEAPTPKEPSDKPPVAPQTQAA